MNGNIQSILRRSDIDGNETVGIIDDLLFHYSGNKLIGVDDSSTNNSPTDFNDNGSIYSPGNNEYGYDANGNIAVIRLTGVASRKVGIFGSVIIFLLAFSPKITYSITLIPNPVLGSSTLVLMGLLFASGIKLIASSELDFASGIIVGASFTVGILTTFKLFPPPFNT